MTSYDSTLCPTWSSLLHLKSPDAAGKISILTADTARVGGSKSSGLSGAGGVVRHLNLRILAPRIVPTWVGLDFLVIKSSK